jgi:hypothetical protein
LDPERPEYQRITLTYDYNAKVDHYHSMQQQEAKIGEPVCTHGEGD